MICRTWERAKRAGSNNVFFGMQGTGACSGDFTVHGVSSVTSPNHASTSSLQIMAFQHRFAHSGCVGHTDSPVIYSNKAPTQPRACLIVAVQSIRARMHGCAPHASLTAQHRMGQLGRQTRGRFPSLCCVFNGAEPRARTRRTLPLGEQARRRSWRRWRW
jgi:hypothetical protein